MLSPCKNRKADSENKNKTKRTRTNKTKQQKTRQHGWWSADQFIVLAMYKEDDSFVSPRDWYGRGKTKQQTKKDHNYAIQKSVSQESTKAQCGNQGSPQPGASRSQSAAARATFSQIVRYDPKASDDTVIWHMGKRK